MNITKEKLDDLNAVVSVKVVEEDYRQRVEDVLKDYRKKAKLDGFRPGMVPMGIIRKLYYKPVLAEEINKIVSESLMNYIRDEKIRLLGEPLPHIDKETTIDFDKDSEFEFSFDLGLVPDFTLNIGSKDKIPFYTIKVEDTAIEEYVDNIRKRFGEFVSADQVKGNELISGNLKAVDPDNKVPEDLRSIEDIRFSIEIIKDKSVKNLFTGAKKGDKIAFDVKKAFTNETDLAGLFKTGKEKVAYINGLYEVDITDVLEFVDHPVDQDLFDKTFGEGAVKSEGEFREKIADDLKKNYEYESNYRFVIDTRKYLVNKAGLTLPVEFLKRWILARNEKMTSEQLEQEFSNYEEEFQWQLIKDQLINEAEISVSDDELLQFALQMTRNQFYQYGLYNVQEEHIVKYAREQLNRPEESNRLRDQKYEEKIILFMKETVKLDKKEVTREKFRKLFDKD